MTEKNAGDFREILGFFIFHETLFRKIVEKHDKITSMIIKRSISKLFSKFEKHWVQLDKLHESKYSYLGEKYFKCKKNVHFSS